MMIAHFGIGPLGFSILAATALIAHPVPAETLDSTNADNRLLVAFDVADAALAEFIPDGWAATPFGGGAFAGADLVLVFIDSHRIVDPEGKPKYGGRYRAMAVAVPAAETGADRKGFLVTHVFVSDASINPYRNSVGAEVTREASSTGTGADAAASHQSWSVAPETGGNVALSLAWTAGMPGVSQGESNIHSAVDPELYRIYRYEQYADLVKSLPADVDRVESLAIEVSIPELAPLFDGTEALVAILDLPWYMREIWLP